MSANSKIEWTDVTWNPTRGCSLVSKGCENCYAMKQAHRFSGPGGAYEGLTRLGKHGPVWTGDIRLVPETLDQPLRWRKPRRVFVNSMSDLFHEGLTNEEIAAVFGVMAAAHAHTFQVLTKRPKRMLEWFRWIDREGNGSRTDRADEVITIMFGVGALNNYLTRNDHDNVGEGDWDHLIDDPPPWPLPNVWLGVSVEDQKTADERIPLLLRTPAAVRFISAEPLIGPVDIGRAASPRTEGEWLSEVECGHRKLHWAIVGGESGHGARPMHPDWARSIRDQCVEVGVAFHFKQWGAFTNGPGGFVRVGKKAAGRVLDGRTWDEFPTRSGES